MKKLLIVVTLALAFFQVTTRAQDFVYKPINPAFGGNPYNYGWLLSQAEAQNTFEEPEEVEDEDPLSNLLIHTDGIDMIVVEKGKYFSAITRYLTKLPGNCTRINLGSRGLQRDFTSLAPTK